MSHRPPCVTRVWCGGCHCAHLPPYGVRRHPWWGCGDRAAVNLHPLSLSRSRPLSHLLSRSLTRSPLAAARGGRWRWSPVTVAPAQAVSHSLTNLSYSSANGAPPPLPSPIRYTPCAHGVSVLGPTDPTNPMHHLAGSLQELSARPLMGVRSVTIAKGVGRQITGSVPARSGAMGVRHRTQTQSDALSVGMR